MSEILGLKKQREKIVALMDCDANDSWATVELYRWQYGMLPMPQDQRKLIPSEGLKGMAKAIMAGNLNNFPTPMNVASVLFYVAKLIEKNAPK
jgi:hypothetical protein